MRPESPKLDRERWRRVEQTARELDDRLDIATRTRAFDGLRWTAGEGGGGRPRLHLEDVTGIPFVKKVPGVVEYQHRARVRAGEGDVFAALTESERGYERYNREVLGIGEPELIKAEPAGGDQSMKAKMAVARACSTGESFDRLCQRAESAGGMVMHPYMAIEDVWYLADRMGERVFGGCEEGRISVLGPPPPVLWVANDKKEMTGVAEGVFGDELTVDTESASRPDRLADLVIDFAERYERVGLKRTRCASAMGNLVLHASEVLGVHRSEVIERVERFLAHTEWEGEEEVLVVEWVDADHSPSTQVWLPPTGEGEPEVEGVYEQLLKGEQQMFIGSRPSTLGASVNRAIARYSLGMAAVFQRLGYVGRCSFDFIVEETSAADQGFDCRLIECNGRWGGTSTPMRLVDRVVAGPRPDYVAMDLESGALEGMRFPELLEVVGDEVYDAETGEGRFIFYNVGPLPGEGKFDVISIGRDAEDARWGAEEYLPEMLGV